MRLTNEMRDAIRRKLISDRFDAEHARITADADVLLSETVVWAWGKDYSSMCKIPTARFVTTNAANFYRVDEHGDDHSFRVRGSGLHPFPNDVEGGATWPRFALKDLPTELCLKIMSHRVADERFRSSRDEASLEIRRALTGFTTIKALYAAWPELAEAVPKPDEGGGVERSKALTKDFGPLNAMLKLGGAM